jgi:protein-tyrosine phosphatase
MPDINWIEPELLKTTAPLGLMSAPGFLGDSVEDDLLQLVADGVIRLVSLVPQGELIYYGVGRILDLAPTLGLRHLRLAIENGGTPEMIQARALVDSILRGLDAGEKTVLHCIGGFGRTGTLAACALVARGHGPDKAIELVRSIRPGTIETVSQEIFVGQFAAATGRLG